MGDLTSRHDAFIRAIMGNQAIALDYFKACLPKHIVKKLDFSTLTQLPDTYVSKELRKTVSDIVYSCKRLDGKGEVRITLLIEHKSYIDSNTPIQIGGYIFSGLAKQISNGQRPSLIIPVLLYHGKDSWKYQTLKDLFSGLEPELTGFLPDYEYVYHNLGDLSDEEIIALHNKFLAASLLAMKYSTLQNELKELIPTILGLAIGEELNLQNQLIVYTFGSSGLNEDQIIAIVQKLPIKIKETVMNTWDVFVEKGRQEGRQEGLQEGQQKEREKAVRNLVKQSLLSDQQIAAALEVTVEYVAGIRKKLEDGV